MNIVDTSGWLEYLADSPLAGNYAAAIENTDELLVPSIVLYEVFKKITLAFDENKAFQAIAQLKQGQVLDMDEAVALYAGKISIEKKLPMADALIYATAILHDATILTQDAHFEWLAAGEVFREIRARPHVTETRWNTEEEQGYPYTSPSRRALFWGLSGAPKRTTGAPGILGRSNYQMCGFAGFLTAGAKVPGSLEAVATRMVLAIRHRGPGDEYAGLQNVLVEGPERGNIIKSRGGLMRCFIKNNATIVSST